MMLLLALLLSGPAPATAPAPTPDTPAPDLFWVAGGTREPVPRQPPETAKQRKAGARLFAKSCAGCHGAEGRGDGALAEALFPPPTDFTKGVYKLRSTPSGSLPTDADLYRTIAYGMHGTAMHPWPRLTVADRWALVAHLRGLSPRFRQETPSPPVVVPPAPPETEALVAKGKALYATYQCGNCHGPDGTATGPGARQYETRGPRPVRIRDFSKGRFIRGDELGELFLTLRTGLDGTPMGAYDSLSDEETWALAAYVRSLVRQRPLRERPGVWGLRR